MKPASAPGVEVHQRSELESGILGVRAPDARDTPRAFVLPIASKPDRAMLAVLAGPGEGVTIALDSVVTLGRATNATLTLDEPSVSRVHARIVRDERGRHVLEDLGSTNGTFVEGCRISRVALRSGDHIQLGRECIFRFALVDEAEAQLQRRLYESAVYDMLTGLANRRYLFDRLASETSRARREGGHLALLMIDLDYFKSINDSYGHLKGDEVLKAVAVCASRIVRAGDVLARYGGEELVVLARNASRADASSLAERIRTGIAALSFEGAGAPFGVTVSIGIAVDSECDGSSEGLELLARADARAYAAKMAGRNRVVAAG